MPNPSTILYVLLNAGVSVNYSHRLLFYMFCTIFCRFATLCLNALSLYISHRALSPSDRRLLGSLDFHLDKFVQHLKWLNPELSLPETVMDKLSVLILLAM